MKFISVGKYSTKLYHAGNDTQSSVCGGIVTVIIIICLLLFSVTLMQSTLANKSDFVLSENTEDISKFGVNFTLRDWTKAVRILMFDVTKQKDCSTLKLTLSYYTDYYTKPMNISSMMFGETCTVLLNFGL